MACKNNTKYTRQSDKELDTLFNDKIFVPERLFHIWDFSVFNLITTENTEIL